MQECYITGSSECRQTMEDGTLIRQAMSQSACLYISILDTHGIEVTLCWHISTRGMTRLEPDWP